MDFGFDLGEVEKRTWGARPLPFVVSTRQGAVGTPMGTESWGSTERPAQDSGRARLPLGAPACASWGWRRTPPACSLGGGDFEVGCSSHPHLCAPPSVHSPEAGGPARALVPPSLTVREGFLLKRKEEPGGLATCFAFKKRYFRLSGETLSYAKGPECQVSTRCRGGLSRVASLPELRLCTQGETEAGTGTATEHLGLCSGGAQGAAGQEWVRLEPLPGAVQTQVSSDVLPWGRPGIRPSFIHSANTH